MEKKSISRIFYQKKLFWRWVACNRRLFPHQPYMLRQEDGNFVIGFRGVSRHITCHFFRSGHIEVRVYYRKIFFDIVSDYDLYEEQTPEGRWVCMLCRDHPHPDKAEPLIEYKDRKDLWIDHSFLPLAAWSKENLHRKSRLCLFRSKGFTQAIIAQGREIKKCKRRRDLYKILPVVTTTKER